MMKHLFFYYNQSSSSFSYRTILSIFDIIISQEIILSKNKAQQDDLSSYRANILVFFYFFTIFLE